jgi:hypothetical protein
VSPGLVYVWVNFRVLRHYRLGGRGKRGRILIDRADLDSFLQSCRVDPVRGPHSQPPPAYVPKYFTLD